MWVRLNLDLGGREVACFPMVNHFILNTMDDSNTGRKQAILQQLLEERERRKQAARLMPKLRSPEPVEALPSFNDDAQSVVSQQSKSESMVARMLEERRAERSMKVSLESQ